MAPHGQHAVEIVEGNTWSVRVTFNGVTKTVAFTAESYARSYADGQAFRLGVEVVKARKCA